METLRKVKTGKARRFVVAAVAAGCLFAAADETFTNGNLSVTFKSGWPVSISRDGKVVLARSPRLLFQAWRPDGTDAVRHAFMDGDVSTFNLSPFTWHVGM